MKRACYRIRHLVEDGIDAKKRSDKWDNMRRSDRYANREEFRSRAITIVRSVTLALVAVIGGLWSIDGTAVTIPFGDANTVVRKAADSETVAFVLTLPLQNAPALDVALKDMYDASNPAYRHFITPEKFIATYAPSESMYSALKLFAKNSGFKITGEYANRTVLDVSGDVATIRRIFNAQMYWYQTRDGKQFVAPDGEPRIPAELSQIGGDAAALKHTPLKPFVRISKSSANTGGQYVAPNPGAIPDAGSGPSGSYEPGDIKTAYNASSIQNGGQSVALYEGSTGPYSDAATYASTFGLNSPTITSKSVSSSNCGTVPATAQLEVMLDIEMLMAISNPTQIYVYSCAPDAAGWLAAFQQMASDNIIGEVSVSWGECESYTGSSTLNAENSVLKQMAAQGIAVFASTGDTGVLTYGCTTGRTVNDPASQPYVTAVGGTTLTTSPSHAYTSETAWNDSDGATGGGVSAYWSIPNYQTELTPADTQFSTSLRNVPDVALIADPATGYYIYCSNGGNGCVEGVTTSPAGWNIVGGTSASAPLWAGFWSLVSKGFNSRAGFANPTIYSIATSSTLYSSSFHDVPAGSNNGYFDTFTGYDNATGLGSFNGANLYSSAISIRRAYIIPIISFLLN